MQVHIPVLLPVARLCADPCPAKKDIGKKDLAGLRAMLAEFGFAGVMNVASDPGDTYVVLDGNTRLEETRAAGVVEVPCIIHESLAYTFAGHELRRREFAMGYDAHRKSFDRKTLVKQLQDLANSGRDLKHLQTLSGVANLTKVLDPDARARVQETLDAAKSRAAQMESLVLFGPSDDINTIRLTLNAIKGEFSSHQKVQELLRGSAVRLPLDDESFLTVFLAALCRHQKSGE